MSRMRMDQEILEVVPEKPSACTKFLHYTWKTITFLFSHIALVSTVVSYCALGAFTFEALEVEHEKEVKRKISGIRNNVTNYLWNLTLGFNVLDEDNFTRNATDLLYNFESALVKSMTKDGWDGEEDESTVQWTRTGSLFYSIVVITTIGYGHIAPKTTWGKVVTIFYAILGIPLMLLCLSNIGDIMATSFRFLYWKICCYACTRPKKPRRSRSVRSGRAMSERSRSVRNPSFRRSVRTSTRSGDSGFDFSEVSTHPTSHSDTELRIANEMNFKRVQSLPKMRQLQNQNQNNLHTGTLPSRKRSAPTKSQCPPNPSRIQAGNRGGSLDRKKISKGVDLDLDPFILNKIPILCADQYMISRDEFVDMCINEQEEEEEAIPGIQLNKIKRGQSPPNERRSLTLPRPQRSSLNMPRPKSSNFLELPRGSSPTNSERSHTSARSHQSTRKVHRKKSPVHSSPKMMTPLGYGHKSKYLDDPESDEEIYDDIYYDAHKTRTPPVPIWLCVFLVVSYIIAGAFLFQNWENWRFIDAAYFCFITLTTIGFGDLVPAKGVSQNVGGDETTTAVTISIALCSLYLLFGISLLAMSFNLVQEQVINSVKSVAKTLGIIKSEGDETDDEDY